MASEIFIVLSWLVGFYSFDMDLLWRNPIYFKKYDINWVVRRFDLHTIIYEIVLDYYIKT